MAMAAAMTIPADHQMALSRKDSSGFVALFHIQRLSAH
jgi:hypothetical protein